MDANKIIAQGTEAKFKVEIKGFDMVNGDFIVELIYDYYRTTVTVEKGQMVKDEHDHYFFYLDTDCIVGEVIARCMWLVPDEDAENDLRTMIDEQVLCFVSTMPNPNLPAWGGITEGPQVKYTYIPPVSQAAGTNVTQE